MGLGIGLGGQNLVAWWLGGLLGLGLMLEGVLRWRFGFGRPVLYQGDNAMGYVLVPNQTTRRMGKRIAINAYSMRSAAIAPQPAAGTERILMLGDSIVNGGWWTDQEATLSACLEQRLLEQRLLEQRLRAEPAVSGVEVLNASANSWGPRNELAYVQRFGTFGAQRLILVINTDDLFAVAPSAVAVGRDRNYPDRLPLAGFPPGAILEVLQRLWPRQSDPVLEAAQQEEGDRVARNLAAIAQLQAITQGQGMAFLLVMTPLQRELAIAGGPRDYEVRERARLLAFTQEQEMQFIDMLPRFDRDADPRGLYHDHIHLNGQGNGAIVEAIVEAVVEAMDAGHGET